MYAVRKGREIGLFSEWSDCEDSVKGYKGAEFRKVKSEDEGYAYINGEKLQSDNYYAIKYGDGRSEIVRSWDECKEKAQGVSGVKFKKFKNIRDAKIFLNGDFLTTEPMIKDLSIPTFYIDGSFKEDSIGFGVLLRINGNDKHYKGKTNGSLRNVSGEIAAMLFTLHTAKEYNYHEINVVYDYEGILDWLDGTWKAKSKEADDYKGFVVEFLKTHNIKIHYYKCSSHSGVEGNTVADNLAKQGAKSGVYVPLSALFSEEIDKEQCVG